MRLERYQLKSEESLHTFEFISEGRNGKVHKIVQFTETNVKSVFNLGFGDKNIETGLVDDSVITNNEDSQKVLVTVASAVFAFTSKYPDCFVFAAGLTKSRTRLYRMGISNNFDDISESFVVYGLLNEEWVIFNKNIEYEAFLVKRKF